MNVEKLTVNNSEQELIHKLIDSGQEHLFTDWDPPGTNDQAKTEFLASLSQVDSSYPDGLAGYISNARKLLVEAGEGTNPFEGFTPMHPDCTDLTQFDNAYDHYESLGKNHFNKIAVVLVAGGLGERLGYNGIKLDIPIEVIENTSYLAHYALCLKAMETRMKNPKPVPFIIMVSEDTDQKTRASLKANNYFGLKQEQVHILKQELVPAIADNEGRLALKEKYQLVLKPHGHGDIHMLLHSSGIATRLEQDGIEHLVFIQDTNGQVFNAVPAALGVSVEKNFDFNSIAVNRIPGEAVGALARLKKKDSELTLNVEYNQLDPLLRATVSPEGDVPNEQGFSMFPGNINALIIKLSSYNRILKRTEGIIAEFVNPKYIDESRTAFKSPTRLETMMQDLPKLFGPDEKTGVSVFNRKWAFSANKNNIDDATAKAASGEPPESAATAESDFYLAGRIKLAAAGMTVKESASETVLGIPITPGPRIILRPSFAMTLQEVRDKISGGSITGDSALILDGPDIHFENVEIPDGSALIIHACEKAKVTAKNITVQNNGLKKTTLTKAEMSIKETPEYLKLRGYRIENFEAAIREFKEPGTYDI